MTNKRLFMLRHAQALPSSAGDKSRALSPKGIKDAKALGRIMSEQGYIPDIVLCSPAKRTRQTLENLQTSLQITSVEFAEILYNGSTGDYLYEIQKISGNYNNILIIAHNPCIYELVILLAKQGNENLLQKLSMGYPPASLSVIKCKCESWLNIKPEENELIDLIV